MRIPLKIALAILPAFALMVAADNAPLAISPASLSFTTTGTAPQSASLSINSGREGVALGSFSAAASTNSGGNWLAVSPATGSGPSTLTVTATPGPSLAAGTY